MAERILDVQNLKIDFHTYAGEVKAIRDVSFHLDRGETLAIVGESGSGKSVTTKSLMGLLANNAKVKGGRVMFHGDDILQYSEKKMQTIRGHCNDLPGSDDFSGSNYEDWAANCWTPDEA